MRPLGLASPSLSPPPAQKIRFKILDSLRHTRFPSPRSNAPVAQLDRASDYESEGWGFEFLRVYALNTLQIKGLRGFSCPRWATLKAAEMHGNARFDTLYCAECRTETFFSESRHRAPLGRPEPVPTLPTVQRGVAWKARRRDPAPPLRLAQGAPPTSLVPVFSTSGQGERHRAAGQR